MTIFKVREPGNAPLTGLMVKYQTIKREANLRFVATTYWIIQISYGRTESDHACKAARTSAARERTLEGN